jgi:putative two-component system response regulator
MNAAGNDFGVEAAVRLRAACEAHDPSEAAHLARVGSYSVLIGRLVGFDPAGLSEVEHAAPLHDLGKIGLPLRLFHKGGALTPAERKAVERHTTIGFHILEASRSPLLQRAARIALAHHESWDGSGYPNAWKADQIPLDARIVAVADVFDALLSRRSYKEAWDMDRVLAEMRRLRESKFDPEIADVFLANIPGLAAV